MLCRAIHLAAVLFLLKRLSLVVFFLTACQGDVHLGTALVIDKDKGRNDGQTGSLRVFGQMTDLPLIEQRLRSRREGTLERDP